MKKSAIKLFGILAITSAVLFTSCSDDDDKGSQPTSTFVVDATNFKGNINDGEVVLQSNVEYKLTGALVIGNGATLTIPAGTRIVATSELAYVAVAQGGKINVDGNAASPVVLTSAAGTPGTWGGLVICGKAPINKAATAQSEVAELTYGGTETNDNSGSIKFLRIEYAGKIITGDKEFNGLSMFGVGAGTVIENVQAYKGSDDGFEWFGGTVNTKNLISTGNEDDQFDWTEGWAGTNENWYGKEAGLVANRGIEADNLEDNETATPTSFPKIKNMTLIGITSSGEPQGIELRRGTKANIDNVVLNNWATGVRISGAVSQGYAGGDIKVTNVKFGANVTTKFNSEAASAVTENANATGAGNGEATPTWAAGWTRFDGI